MDTSNGGGVRQRVRVALSTGSVYPEGLAAGFDVAGRLGYDGVEVMVGVDPASQDLGAIRRLSDHYGVPVLAVHAPCLLLTQRVWGNDPWAKLVRAREVAEAVGAATVVVHPPFRWQREYARGFTTGLARMESETDVVFAVENMFPLRTEGVIGREVVPYAPHWSPVELDLPAVTLDLSHTAVSRSDPLVLATVLGPRLAHVHLADGTGSPKDEHLVPGRGGQPCGPLLDLLAREAYSGVVVVEVNTRGLSRPQREADLGEALQYARCHLDGVPLDRSA